MKCTKGFEIKVLKANMAYIGTVHEDGFPNCRCSDYFDSINSANQALETGFTVRSCMENDFCNKGKGCFSR